MVEYCWVDEAGEDAYEFHYPRTGNIVRYCGGEDVHNQMVDLWSNAPTAYENGVLVHDIWGECGGEALSISNVSNVEAYSILVDNSKPLSGEVPEPPRGEGVYGNVVIRTEGFDGQPNGCYIHGEISSPAQSAKGIPIVEVVIDGATLRGTNSVDEVF